MGSSASRGQIEEFAIDFVNEGTKVIQFEADRLDVAGFSGPPTVKLISVENHTKKLYQKQNLFDGDLNLTIGSTRGTGEPEATDVSGSIAPEKLTSETMPAEYRPTLANLGNLQRKAVAVTQATSPSSAQDNHVTIPFHEIESLGEIPTTDSTLEFYFQLRLKGGWDLDSGEKIIFRFPTVGQVHGGLTTTKFNRAEQFQNIVFEVQALKVGVWTTIGNPSGIGGSTQYSASGGMVGDDGIRMDRLLSAMGSSWIENMTVSGNFQWIRVMMSTLSRFGGIPYDTGTRWEDLGGIQIQNDGNATDEQFDIANPMFFMKPAGTHGVSVFQAGAPDYLDYDLVNPNVLVSFRAVSRTGMTILTSSRFTGTIKYLVSFGG